MFVNEVLRYWYGVGWIRGAGLRDSLRKLVRLRSKPGRSKGDVPLGLAMKEIVWKIAGAQEKVTRGKDIYFGYGKSDCMSNLTDLDAGLVTAMGESCAIRATSQAQVGFQGSARRVLAEGLLRMGVFCADGVGKPRYQRGPIWGPWSARSG